MQLHELARHVREIAVCLGGLPLPEKSTARGRVFFEAGLAVLEAGLAVLGIWS